MNNYFLANKHIGLYMIKNANLTRIVGRLELFCFIKSLFMDFIPITP